jgi:hypothetical protein
VVLELVLLVLLFVTLGGAGPHFLKGLWLALWLLVLAGIVVPMMRHARAGAQSRGVAVAVLILLGGLALRIAVVFGAQA